MEDTIRTELRETGKFMMASGLAWGNAGNISARVTPDTCLISASGTWLGELGADDLVPCSIPEARALSGTVRPSKELAMHAAIYQERPDIQAVLHASPLHATLLACAAEPLPSNLFVETMYYLERIERVPYAHPGSRELAEEVRRRAASANVLLLENHGVLVYDTSLKEARTALQTLEMASRMVIAARSAGIRLKGLPEETVRSFLTESGYRPVRKWGTP